MDGRKVPIIQDAELVDMSFGTGAVKITPAHDPNDYATGKRHNLQCINILDDDGRMNPNGGQFAGQPRFTVSSLYPAVMRCATQFLLSINHVGPFESCHLNSAEFSLFLESTDNDWRTSMVLGTYCGK